MATIDQELLNSTIVTSVAQASNDLVNLAQILVGGFVGLYILNIIITYYNNRKMISLLLEIRNEMRSLNTRKRK
ncbi:MAG TPA: hypothetical protein VJB12_00415 [Candidatus Nanoarchaeia archaeon]|nr:hypothetical protein [Candidatus Nanoarchaeia archaeon]